MGVVFFFSLPGIIASNSLILNENLDESVTVSDRFARYWEIKTQEKLKEGLKLQEAKDAICESLIREARDYYQSKSDCLLMF